MKIKRKTPKPKGKRKRAAKKVQPVNRPLSGVEMRELDWVINQALDQCDPDATPRICAALGTPDGRQRMYEMTLVLMGRDGISAGAALAQIDTELLG
ncbi:MAG: hypothetical protein H6581_20675 [Bacteroidia bacterium]|nr:hypothetical protein [Bacteroidia bacterium]